MSRALVLALCVVAAHGIVSMPRRVRPSRKTQSHVVVRVDADCEGRGVAEAARRPNRKAPFGDTAEARSHRCRLRTPGPPSRRRQASLTGEGARHQHSDALAATFASDEPSTLASEFSSRASKEGRKGGGPIFSCAGPCLAGFPCAAPLCGGAGSNRAKARQE